ncbi:MAG: 2-hydroxyacid dehydrogenase [Pirellulaceae bacterium]|jgi:D-lactate dehydrogenase
MKCAVFSTRPDERRYLEQYARDSQIEWVFHSETLHPRTVSLARDCQAICVFVNDQLNTSILDQLHAYGVRCIALRCAGFNQVDLSHADRLGIPVVRVPAYSPHAVAEHTFALLLAINRKIHKAYNRVRDSNFALEGLLGFDLHGKTLGIVGTGKIGSCVARIAHGFGMNILLHDPIPSKECEALGRYVALDALLSQSKVVSLHCPLSDSTRHLICTQSLALMPPKAILINTSRGALVDTPAVIQTLKSGHLGALAIDVYEEEADLFFADHSGEVLQDDVFSRLLTFPNVLITGHQAFFTEDALQEIAKVTVANLSSLLAGQPCKNAVGKASLVPTAIGHNGPRHSSQTEL